MSERLYIAAMLVTHLWPHTVYSGGTAYVQRRWTEHTSWHSSTSHVPASSSCMHALQQYFRN